MTIKRDVKSLLRIFIYSYLLTTLFFCLSYRVAAENREMDLSFSGDLYFKNHKNGKLWMIAKSEKFHLADSARQYLKKLNEGEYNDWRFPTQQELYDLFVIFDLMKNGEVKIHIEGAYWLMSDNGKLNVGAWEIGDGCGPERTFFSLKKGVVMAVRP